MKTLFLLMLAANPTFYKDVLPILQNHCQSCHRPGQIGPMPLLTFAQAQPKAAAIAGMVRSRKMPPWFADPRYGHFGNDPSMTTYEIETIGRWADSGAPAGNPQDAPPKRWIEGWNIPQPDTVIRMPKPVNVPSHGDVEYTYEIVPSGFTQDKWVQMSEIRPASRPHVHHAVVYIRPPDSSWLRKAPLNQPFTASSLADPHLQHEAHWTDATCFWSMRQAVHQTSGPTEWLNLFPPVRTLFSRCTTQPTGMPIGIKRRSV
jgi:hypothetical protein